MRRIDAILIVLGFFVFGGACYLGLEAIGFSPQRAGIGSQVIMLMGLLGWLFTYVFRVATGTMTLNQQVENYKKAVLQKRLEEMTPEEIAELQSPD